MGVGYDLEDEDFCCNRQAGVEWFITTLLLKLFLLRSMEGMLWLLTIISEGVYYGWFCGNVADWQHHPVE